MKFRKTIIGLLTTAFVCATAGFAACMGGSSGTGTTMREIPPNALDINVENIEVSQDESFEVTVRLAWDNWQWGPDVTPCNDLLWSIEMEEGYTTDISAYSVNMEMHEPGNGVLEQFCIYEFSIHAIGTHTVTATSRFVDLSDSFEVTVLEKEGEVGGEEEYQPCPEENLDLELVGDHYVVKGIGDYQLGSVDIGLYWDQPMALNIYNQPNGIPITEIADGAFSGLNFTHFGSSTITKVGDRAFENCTDLQALIFEGADDYTVDIGAYAFTGCENLTKVTSNVDINSVGEYAFANLPNFYTSQGMDGELVLPYTAGATIGAYAFAGCTAFTYVSNYDDVYFGEYAFADCTGLEEILHFTAKEIGAYAFSGCYNIKQGLRTNATKIGEYAFENCEKLQYVAFESAVEIGESAFAITGRKTEQDTVYNTKLGDVTFDNGATYIGKEAFKGCRELTNVCSYGDIGTISEQAFYGCTAMYKFWVEGGVNEVYAGAFGNCGSKIEQYYVDRGYKYLQYHVEDGTKIFRQGAMSGAMLSELDISKAEVLEYPMHFGGEVYLTLPDYFTEIPEGMFESCHGLYGITFTSDITKIGKLAFARCPLSDPDFKLPDTVTRIEEKAFYNCSLTNGELPSSLKYIGEQAFYGAKNFVGATVIWPATLEEICESAFAETKVEKLVAGSPKTSDADCVSMTVWRNTFQNCTSLKEVDFTGWNYRNMRFVISPNMFDGCASLKTVNLGYIAHIGVEAFKGCTSLTSFLVIPTNHDSDTINNANVFRLQSNGLKTITLTLEDLADGAKMAQSVKSGAYDNYGWQAMNV